LKLQREDLDVADLLGEVAASFAAKAQEAGVSLRVEAAPGLPHILADGVRIREVVGNLVSNSLRYTPRGGGITLAARAEDTRKMLIVSVSDTGAGIAPDALEHIFDRFYKSGDSGGSGLGLAIARQLVLAHGGAMYAQSQPGAGALISFEIPFSL
jgi:two-component system sensor histidine kinase BaeS